MKSFDIALDQPIANMGRRGFGLNRKSHVARGAASGSTMVNTMVGANFRLDFFGERAHILVRARTHHLYSLAIDLMICIHFVSNRTRGKKSCLNPVHKYVLLFM